MQNTDWLAVLKLMEKNIDTVRFETWFKPLIFAGYIDNCIYLETKNADIADFLNHNHKKTVLNYIQKVYPNTKNLEIKEIGSFS